MKVTDYTHCVLVETRSMRVFVCREVLTFEVPAPVCPDERMQLDVPWPVFATLWSRMQRPRPFHAGRVEEGCTVWKADPLGKLLWYNVASGTSVSFDVSPELAHTLQGLREAWDIYDGGDPACPC